MSNSPDPFSSVVNVDSTRIDLSGEWQLRSSDGEYEVAARVPGDTHSALLDANKIEDPYWGRNELEVQDLARKDWLYSRVVEISEELLSAPSIFLHIESLDTIGEVWVNGVKLLETDNMFVRHRVEAKSVLRAGENEIEIRISSAELEAKRRAAAAPYPLPQTNAPIQSPHRNLVRKVQCHGGWDWGPCLMVSGINGPIVLATNEKGRIEYTYTEQTHRQGVCELEVFCEFESLVEESICWSAAFDGEIFSFEADLVKGANLLRGSLVVEEPKLWWPNGYGEAKLYDLSIEVAEEVVEKRIGLRKMDLVYEEDEVGLSFVARVNGVNVFCKGANWIPMDALPQRQTREAYEDLLTSSVDANMNMIRVWGGGQYEQDVFYELCDEKGLLVWQDFMFACSMYPSSKDFLESVEREAIHQVKRLRDHACIALWCGNNENIGALNWYEESRKNRDRYIVDYDRLNSGVLQRVTEELDPARVFWPSSPCGGPNDYSDAFHNDRRGDMHYWDVWHRGMNLEAYYEVTPRFCSEFGYQSFPSMEVVKTYAEEGDLNVTSPVMEHHQRNKGGNSKIVEMFTRYFRMPVGADGFIYLSQILQGLAIKMAVEHWRHLRPVCMGTLYWQLNDNWPVCSWASVNYGGKWKLLHHMAKEFYAPTIVSAFQKEGGDSVEIWLTNDRLEQVKGTVTLRVIDFSGKVLRSESFDREIVAEGAEKLMDLKIDEWTDSPEGTFLSMALETEEGLCDNTHFFAKYKTCEIEKAEISVSAAEIEGELVARVSTDKPAFFVSVDAEGISGEFDQNGFTLLPGEDRELVFRAKEEGVSADSLKGAIKVRDLRGTY
ncbi:MAG: glycoside hydrolase family 2 protein [Verrucomicrobiota bacterium]